MRTILFVMQMLFWPWAICALAALLAPFSVHLGVLDALRQPVLLSAAILLPPIFLFRQWRQGFVMSLLMALVAAPWMTAGSVPVLPGDCQITIILLPSSSSRALEYALSRSADVVIVPDFSDRTATQLGPSERVLAYPTENASEIDSLGPLTAAYHPWVVDGAGGLGVFLRHNIVAADSILLRPTQEGRTLIFDARIQGTELTFAVTHLDRPFPIDKYGRQAAAVDALARQLADIPRPVILAGDFNALPWSAAVSRLSDAIGAAPPLWVGTFPTGFPLRLPIDQIRAGSGLSITSLTAGPDVGSVHLPVEAVVSLKH